MDRRALRVHKVSRDLTGKTQNLDRQDQPVHLDLKDHKAILAQLGPQEQLDFPAKMVSMASQVRRVSLEHPVLKDRLAQPVNQARLGGRATTALMLILVHRAFLGRLAQPV